MNRVLRILAAAIALSAVAFWTVAGAHRGWTQTSVPVRSIDEVTGLEGITYKPRFVPGLDFLGTAWLGATVLAGVSFVFRKNKQL